AAEQDNWGAPKVQVLQQEGKWIIKGLRNRIELNPSNLQMTVYAGNRRWSMIPSFSGDLIVEKSESRLSLRLADAGKKEILPYQTGFKTGLKIFLKDFVSEDKKLDVQIQLFICLEGKDEELVCEVISSEKNTAVLECFWPQAVADDCFDYTIIQSLMVAVYTCRGGVIKKKSPPCSFCSKHRKTVAVASNIRPEVRPK
ncbi:MAG: hypothetical protein ACYS17_14045, partial [Planctomycetota bacterium]